MFTLDESETFWNQVLTVLYIGYLALALWALNVFAGGVPDEFAVSDFALLSLAIMRLVRLFVYDRITRFIRDWFSVPPGVRVRSRVSLSGFRYTIAHLFGCPWCIAVWIVPPVAVAYFATPYARFVALILALAGVASALQIMMNLVGWTAERQKQAAQAHGGVACCTVAYPAQPSKKQ